MCDCSQLRSFPDISSNIKTLSLRNTKIEDVPPSVAGCLSHLEDLNICSRSLKRLTHVPLCITALFLSNSDIERIPDCVIGLARLVRLNSDIERILILPYKDNSYEAISCSIRSKGGVIVNNLEWFPYLSLESKHLLISHGDLFRQRRCHEVDVTMSEITFEFNHKYNGDKIIECGVQIMTEEAEGSSSTECDNFETESSRSEVDSLENENSRSEADNYETESSSSEVDYYENEGNNNHHTDEDGDGDYEAEGCKFSQDENIKTSKHTGFKSWLREFGLKEK